MPNRVPAGLDELLAAFRTKLVTTDRVFASDRLVPLTLNGDPEGQTVKPPGDRFLTLWPKKAAADLGLTAGGGRAALTFEGVLEASLWQRVPVDVFGSDEDYLLDAARGYYATFAAVVSSLEQFDPAVGAGPNLMLSEPLRITGFRTFPRKGGAAFARVAAEFKLVFQMLLPTLPVPPP